MTHASLISSAANSTSSKASTASNASTAPAGTQAGAIDAARIAGRYLAAWNETDSARCAGLVAAAFAPDAVYLDPMMEGEGHEGISGLIGAVQQRFAGHRFVLKGEPETHHDVVRFSWTLAPGDGAGAGPVAIGTDVVEVAADGRLSRVTGFIDYFGGA